MPDKIVKAVSVRFAVDGYEDAKLKIDRLNAGAEEFKRQHPEIAPKIDSTKALLEARLLAAGIKRELANTTADPGGGWFSRLNKGAAGAAGGIPFVGGPLGSAAGALGPAGGIAVLGSAVAAAAALVVEIAAIGSGVAAAATGVAAFALLARPTFDRIAAAAGLTGDRLRDLPAGMRNAALGVQGLEAEFGKLSAQLRPITITIADTALQIANKLLPALKPMATAAGTAIEGLLKQFDRFVSSKGFQDWLAKFDTLIGPAITAIGHGIDLIITQLGKLITRFSGRDVAHAINLFFDAILVLIGPTVKGIGYIMTAFDKLERFIVWSAGIIVTAAAKAFGWLPGIGPKLQKAAADFNNWVAGINGGLSTIAGQAASTSAALAGVAYAAINAFNKSKLVPTAGNAVPHAAGGPASGMILVGERGPEILQVPTGSYVYNNQQSRGMLSGGGSTYNINVRVAPGGEREAGRQIVNAIRAFEKGSGSGWRHP